MKITQMHPEHCIPVSDDLRRHDLRSFGAHFTNMD